MEKCISVSCFKGASSLGDRYTAEFDGRETVTVENRPAHYLPTERTVCKVDGKKLREELSRIASEHRIPQLGRLQPDPLAVCDAPGWSVSFAFDNGKTVTVGSGDLLPPCSAGICNETVGCLQKACREGSLLSGKKRRDEKNDR